MRHSIPSRRRFVAAIGAAAAVAAAPRAFAKSYPSRSIKLVMPFPPGGPTDQLGRLVSFGMKDELKEAIVVENYAGAGGTLGAQVAARAAPDGYTLMFGNTATLAIAPAIYTQLAYDPLTSFTPIGLVSTGSMVVVVNSKLPVKTLSDLIALAKSQPGKLNFGSAGIGTPLHLGGELLNQLAGTRIEHVPYKGGGPALTGLLRGEVQVYLDLAPTLIPYIKNGAIRPLAIAGPARLPVLPDVPTAAEAGLPGFDIDLFTGLVGPAGLAQDVVSRLGAALRKALALKEVADAASNSGYALASASSPPEFHGYLERQVAAWAKVAEFSHAKVR